jgi:hypothetical protein
MCRHPVIMNAWKRLITLAEAQYGAFSLAQAADFHITERDVQRRTENEGWERLHSGVYVLPGATPSCEQASMGALLAVRPGRPTGQRGVLVTARSARGFTG